VLATALIVAVIVEPVIGACSASGPKSTGPPSGKPGSRHLERTGSAVIISDPKAA